MCGALKMKRIMTPRVASFVNVLIFTAALFDIFPEYSVPRLEVLSRPEQDDGGGGVQIEPALCVRHAQHHHALRKCKQ